jgi:hypothetical protein
MRRASIFVFFLLLVMASGPLWADQSIRLRVSATILPRPCEYPHRCDPVPAATQTKAIVDNGVVSYVGSPPEVTEKDSLMTVKF